MEAESRFGTQYPPPPYYGHVTIDDTISCIRSIRAARYYLESSIIALMASTNHVCHREDVQVPAS